MDSVHTFKHRNVLNEAAQFLQYGVFAFYVGVLVSYHAHDEYNLPTPTFQL